MALFKKSTGGFADVIRCDEPDYLIWKWHPAGLSRGETARDNSIRWGSSLRVKEGSVAVFVYKPKTGEYQDFVEGPFDDILKTKNLPVLSDIIGAGYAGQSPFQAEVYFINLAKIIQSKIVVPFFDVYDPRFPDFGVPVAVHGTITYSISDYREFIKLHRLDNFSLDDFQKQIRDAVSRYTKEVVINIPSTHNIPVIHLETKISELNDLIESKLSNRLVSDFGVRVSGVDIAAAEIDKSSDGYKQLMSVTKDVTAAKVHAETADYMERLRILREEEQFAMHKKTQSENIGAFQVEKQAEVGIAGADALGKMGANGAGGINLGGSDGVGVNPAAMMAGMAVGGAVGQNIAGTMSGIMSGANTQSSMTPPPIPAVTYNVVINGQSAGPYDMATLSQMAQAGQIKADTLVWKPGMSNWAAISTVQELASVLTSIPPMPPEL